MTPPPDAILRFAAALPLILLGVVLLFLRPRRAPQTFFALFAIAWGLQIAVMNYGFLRDDAQTHRIGLLLGTATNAVVALFLVHFAMILRRRPYGWIVSLAATALALTAVLMLFVRPDLFLQLSPGDQGGLSFASTQSVVPRGPLMPLFQGPFWIALLLALSVVYLEYRRAKAGTPRRRYRGLLMAFALFAGYSFVGFFLSYVLYPSGWFPAFDLSSAIAADPQRFVMTLLWVLGALLFSALTIHLLLKPPPPEGRDAPLLFAFLMPPVVAVMEHALGTVGVTLETSGFWRILAVGIIVYTLANHQLFDLDLKLKRYAPLAAAVLVLVGIPVLLTLALGEFGLQPFLFGLIPQVLGVGGIVLFQERVKSALFPGVEDTPDYTHQRKLDIYRVALEETLQRGGAPDDPELKELRLRHQITKQEHDILSWMVASDHGGASRSPGGEAFEPGQTVLDRYRLIRLIGKGSYGKTFLAYDTRSRNEVALKTVDMETFDGAAARLLLREARLAAGLDHPFVIDILDVAELPDRVVVVMEYADNGNLKDRLERQGTLTLPEAVRFLRELLQALESVHEKGIVHRNMKPKNILLEADGSVRLSDFGAAHSSHGDATGKTEFATKTLVNLLYQSPEQIRAEEATPRSDLFVAGVLLHEVLTLKHPFPISGKDDHGIRKALTGGAPRLHLDEHPDWVTRFIKKALSTDPQARHVSAAEMRLELEELAGL